MTASFMQLDFQYGGGYMRTLLLNFFINNVVPLLNQQHPESERRHLFSAAVDVVQLLGWTSYDAGRHAAAQRYFIQGLRLAREAGDHMLGGRLLSNLSHQANHRGHFGDAAKYARAAQQATTGVATCRQHTVPRPRARALASMGDSTGCSRIIHTAETTLDRSNPGSEPAWAWYVDANGIASEWAHCFRDLGDAENAQRFVNQAIEGVAPRTQAFMRVVSAQATLRSGNLDEALATAHRAADLVGPLNSARYQRYLADFHADLMQAHPPRRAWRSSRHCCTGISEAGSLIGIRRTTDQRDDQHRAGDGAPDLGKLRSYAEGCGEGYHGQHSEQPAREAEQEERHAHAVRAVGEPGVVQARHEVDPAEDPRNAHGTAKTAPQHLDSTPRFRRHRAFPSPVMMRAVDWAVRSRGRGPVHCSRCSP